MTYFEFIISEGLHSSKFALERYIKLYNLDNVHRVLQQDTLDKRYFVETQMQLLGFFTKMILEQNNLIYPHNSKYYMSNSLLNALKYVDGYRKHKRDIDMFIMNNSHNKREYFNKLQAFTASNSKMLHTDTHTIIYENNITDYLSQYLSVRQCPDILPIVALVGKYVIYPKIDLDISHHCLRLFNTDFKGFIQSRYKMIKSISNVTKLPVKSVNNPNRWCYSNNKLYFYKY